MMTMRMISIGLALAGGVLLASPAAADIRTACKKDMDAQCKDVKPGGGKVLSCMAEHRAKLSSECKIAIADTVLERRAKKDSAKKEKDEDI